MKRVGTWLIYIAGALSVGYLVLYAYTMLTNRGLQPGDPIKIFRKEDAPKYS